MRIASLSPAVTEILYFLNLQAHIVCIDQCSNFPEEVKGMPRITSKKEIDVRDILDFKPDMIFTNTVVQEKLSGQLTSHNFSIVHQDPRTLNEVYETIRSIGLMFEVEKTAEQLILSMIQGLNDVKKKARLACPQSNFKFYIEQNHTPSMAAGAFTAEVAKFAGGKQFPVPAGEISREVFLSEVVDWNPDLIVLSWQNTGLMAEAELLMQRPGWQNVRAVQEGNVRIIDDALLLRPGPRLIEGAQRLYGWMFEVLH